MAYNGEIITSAQNKYVSLARSLGDKKGREKSSLFRFDGIKLMCEAVRKGVGIEFLIVAHSQYETVFARAEQLYKIGEGSLECRIVVITDDLFVRLSDENAPEGVICVARYDGELHKSVTAEEIPGFEGEKILLLESVRDPQNVGAIIRVAAAFGVDRLVMSRDCADIYSAKTVRASMGTVFSLPVCRVDSVADAVSVLKVRGRRVFAAALDENAARLGQLEISDGDCVVIGNEGHGLSPETVSACTQSVYIPMSDGVESLNAATAAAVLMWEFFG